MSVMLRKMMVTVKVEKLVIIANYTCYIHLLHDLT